MPPPSLAPPSSLAPPLSLDSVVEESPPEPSSDSSDGPPHPTAPSARTPPVATRAHRFPAVPPVFLESAGRAAPARAVVDLIGRAAASHRAERQDAARGHQGTPLPGCASSLHRAPLSTCSVIGQIRERGTPAWVRHPRRSTPSQSAADLCGQITPAATGRSEEHTSELQSRGHLVCRLLLEKKKRRTSNRGQQQNRKS